MIRCGRLCANHNDQYITQFHNLLIYMQSSWAAFLFEHPAINSASFRVSMKTCRKMF